VYIILIWQSVVVVEVHLIQSSPKLVCYLFDGMGLPVAIGDSRFYPGHDAIPAEKDAVLCQTNHCSIFYVVRVARHSAVYVSAVYVPLRSFTRRFAQDAHDISPG
jgi:hypothetical protein